MLTSSGAADASYLLARSVVTILIGDACLTFFLLLICDFVGERNRAALTIAPSTVKGYVHRLLQKTECENRQALIQDFWKSA